MGRIEYTRILMSSVPLECLTLNLVPDPKDDKNVPQRHFILSGNYKWRVVSPSGLISSDRTKTIGTVTCGFTSLTGLQLQFHSAVSNSLLGSLQQTACGNSRRMGNSYIMASKDITGSVLYWTLPRKWNNTPQTPGGFRFWSDWGFCLLS